AATFGLDDTVGGQIVIGDGNRAVGEPQALGQLPDARHARAGAEQSLPHELFNLTADLLISRLGTGAVDGEIHSASIFSIGYRPNKSAEHLVGISINTLFPALPCP